MLYTIIHSSCFSSAIKAQLSRPTYEQLCGNSHKSTSLSLAETSFLDMLGGTILDTNRMPARCGRHQPNRHETSMLGSVILAGRRSGQTSTSSLSIKVPVRAVSSLFPTSQLRMTETPC